MEMDFDFEEVIKSVFDSFKERAPQVKAASVPQLFDRGDVVEFEINNRKVVGKVEIVDRYGTFDQNDEPSYDVMEYKGGKPFMFYKHIVQSSLKNYGGDYNEDQKRDQSE